MSTYFAFISVISPRPVAGAAPQTQQSVSPNVIGVAQCDAGTAKSKLRDFSVQFVQDEVGKNNFADTLEDGKQLKDRATGSFVLAYSDDSKTTINLSVVAEVETGYIRSCKEKTLTQRGYFTMQQVSFDNIYENKYNLAAEEIKRLENDLNLINKGSLETHKKLDMSEARVTDLINKLIAGENNSAAVMHECSETKRKLEEANAKIRELEREAASLREDAKYAVRNHQTPTKKLNVDLRRNDALIDEIKAFHVNKLKPVCEAKSADTIFVDLRAKNFSAPPPPPPPPPMNWVSSCRPTNLHATCDVVDGQIEPIDMMKFDDVVVRPSYIGACNYWKNNRDDDSSSDDWSDSDSDSDSDDEYKIKVRPTTF